MLTRFDGRVLKLSSVFTPVAFASVVARGSCASPGNAAITIGELMTELIVHGIRRSFWFCVVNCAVPFTVVRVQALYSAVALTTWMLLSGATDMRPIAGPLP